MIHSNMMNNIAHVLKVLAAMMPMRHDPFAVNVNLNIVLAGCETYDVRC